MKSNIYKWILKSISNYFAFFLLVAFVITCCTMLFVTSLSNTLGISLTSESLGEAAKLTFLNVAVISLIFTVIDTVRRKLTVERPARQISEAAEKMVKGDFSVRVPRVAKFGTDDSFNDIIESINKIAEELSGVETLRSDFVSNVSHEMKTPLSAIQNYARLLESPTLSDKDRIEYAREAGAAARRLSDMITNILKLNRLENQRIFPECEAYNLTEELCRCLLAFESVWEKKDIEIVTELEEDVYTNIDSELLSLVWNNLLSNAFKFTEPGGTVTVSLKRSADLIAVKISDTGCGISGSVGEHMFEKFYQGDTSHATEGCGLGLSLVRRVVDIVEGEISVDSTVGVGTAFTVKIRGVSEGAINTK